MVSDINKLQRYTKVFKILVITGIIIAFIPAMTKFLIDCLNIGQIGKLEITLRCSNEEIIDFLLSGILAFSLQLCSTPILILYVIYLAKKGTIEKQVESITGLIGAVVAYIIIISFFHISVLYLQKGKPGYSTGALVYFYLPILSIIIMPIGYAIGKKLNLKDKN